MSVHQPQPNPYHAAPVDHGAFSVSLSVADLAVSRAFYEKLGFVVTAGEQAHGYLILRCGAATIGLFEGMFEGNILTFNPGWDQDGNAMASFTDVRDVAASLQALGVELTSEPEPGDAPANLTLLDPDGNAILFDQHVPRP